MHKEILSAHDRQVLIKFIETSEKMQGFRRVKHNMLKYYEQLNQDFTILKKAYEKIGN